MRKPIMVLLATSLALASCSSWRSSRVNPGNWFGKSRTSEVRTLEEGDTTNPLIPKKQANILAKAEQGDTSVAIANITELRVERTSTGATIVATGVATRQGAHSTSLRLEEDEEDSRPDVLTYSFRIYYPDYPTPVGHERTRTIREARSLSNKDLQGIRLIRVKGAQNVREARRR